MKIAVTGSSGFIGKHLLKHLSRSSHEVIEIDLTLGNDISVWESVCGIKEFDVLIHLAAKSYVPEAFNNPADFYRTNVLGTINALELCRLHNARMIFTSSYMYGTPEYLPIDEEHPVKAFNPYAQSKLMGENLCKAYFRDSGVPSCIFRPFNIYGPGQAGHFLIPLIINQAKTGRIRLKDPRPKRDFIYVDDVVVAFVKAVEMKFETIETFNLGSGVSTSIGEVIDIVKEVYRQDILTEFTYEQRKNEVLDTVAKILKAERKLHWKPKVNLRNGIRQLIN